MRVPCSTALAFPVSSPCPPKMRRFYDCATAWPFVRSPLSFLRPATPLRRRALCLRLRNCRGSSSGRQVLGAPWDALEVFDSTLQLWLRAFMSRAIAPVVAQGYLSECAPVTAGSGRESGPEFAECGAEVSGVPSSISVGWSTTFWDVWVAAVVVVEVVNQSHRESSYSTEPAVCTATERSATAARLVPQCCSSTEHLGGTGRLSLEPVLLAVSFFANRCLSGRLTSEPADSDDVLCSASFIGMTHSHFCSSSRCSSVRSFVAVQQAACARKCSGDDQAAILHW